MIWHKRALPIYWRFLTHTGSSNLATQQALLRPVLRLLKGYEIVIVGDREFRTSDYHYQEQGVQQLILNKPVNKLISFRRLMG